MEDLDLDLCLDFCLGDLDLFRLPLELSSLLDDLLELLFLSLILLWTKFSIMGIMSGKGDVPRPDVLLSSDLEVLSADDNLAFLLEGFDSDSDSDPDGEELDRDREPDRFALSASLDFFFFFLFFFFPLS